MNENNQDTKPVEITVEGVTEYRVGNKLHREDGPARIEPNGDQYWYKNGKLHRDNDEPAVITGNGRREWYQHGNLHREDGPAIERIGINNDSAQLNGWWLDGVRYSAENFFRITQKGDKNLNSSSAKMR